MTEEEKLQQQKDAVASMKQAQANMSKAIDRIAALERALRSAANSLDEAAGFVTGYGYRSEVTLREKFLGCAADARKAL